LTNVERHASARRVDLQLHREAGAIVLQIEDDGRGYTPPGAVPERYGVMGMTERIASVGGRFRIAGRPDGGTLVEARVPSSAA
jgi:signal transduction histidine kinase